LYVSFVFFVVLEHVVALLFFFFNDTATTEIYTHTDVVGVELGGALKNVIALAAGILEGLGMGDNTRAALITRGLAEITRLGVALGADPLTFAGLAGMGDLVLTATGAQSRNHSLGVALGAGKSLAEAQAGKPTVAEGVNTARTAVALAERHGVDLPIAREVAAILFEGKAPRLAVADLMERELKREQWRLSSLSRCWFFFRSAKSSRGRISTRSCFGFWRASSAS
jgi:glycerol-3-phosphate dehydrogenase (NAD(P)+)